MNFKKPLKLLYPPTWALILLALICAAALTCVFLLINEENILSYAVYALSFYTLCAVVLRCIKVIPKKYRSAKKKVYSHPLGNRFMTDALLRTHVMLYGSLGINLLYAAANAVSGVLYRSAWFCVLALYYTILAFMRFLLVRYASRIGIGKNYFRELCRSRFCSYLLLTVNVSLSFAVFMILHFNKGYEYRGTLIYAMAAYTFYITVLAAVNLIKYRKLGSPVMTMAKMINMAAALVSMLSLETAMLSEFGTEMSQADKRLMIILTGAGVSACIIAMALFNIVKNSIEIRRIMKGNDDGK
ncbi:MAG: hypothetical protein ACI4QZ_06315 [Eubacteriales bacterium]